MQVHQELEAYYSGAARARTLSPKHENSKHPKVEPINGRLAISNLDSSGRPLYGAHGVDHLRSVLLILEDFDEVRSQFAEHFVQWGYDIFSAATLREALAIAYEEEPRAIIIDHDLSGETPFHAIERLREVLPNSYIVLVGGPNTVTLNDHALMSGASKVLSKAYNLAEIDKIGEEAK